ncbi:MAG TPA: hypothetical protein VII47_15430, partial [Actinomycetota bacterium]
MAPDVGQKGIPSRQALERFEGGGNRHGGQLRDRDVVVTEPPDRLLHAGSQAAKLAARLAAVRRADHRALCRCQPNPSPSTLYVRTTPFILFQKSTQGLVVERIGAEDIVRHSVRDVVVVVPGILGSRLERNGEPIWGSLGLARALADPEGALGLQGDGFAPDPDVEATGLLGRAAQFPGLAKIDAYDALVDGLRASFELDPMSFVEFAYDWRLSCTVNARFLAERIHPVLKQRRR